ncbi:MAG: CtsR family transcriptional regulator [Streptococcaceae bacterium]|nr:CtsR family transcriptional regulator [Streptococcaceae bacterium]MCL2858537.1 CtsR family transcriptional regulator [Streptococcaceae bacterium]
MSNQNTSDIIEMYLRQLLKEAQEIEIKRADLAEHFEVVPSQINYVIKTRFTESKGFDVESKRGGGGYIRIIKYGTSTHHDFLNVLIQKIGQNLTEKDGHNIIQLLFDEEIITEREGNLLLETVGEEISPQIRAKIIKKIIQKLDRER